MTSTRPRVRVDYAKKEMGRLRADVEEWKEKHDAAAEDGWVWEDLIFKANHLYGRIMNLDMVAQRQVLDGVAEFDPETDAAIQALISDWYAIGVKILPHVDRPVREYGAVEGSQEFREKLAEAKAVLTPDREFFVGEELAVLRDRAIEDHLAGRTEPLHADGFAE